MRILLTLAQLTRADFLERTRRYSFLATLGVMLYIGYAWVPPAESKALTVDLGNLRGVYNSAWIGSMIALLGSLLLSLPGFYLVKNGITRDRQTRVGQIIAATPLSKISYTLGKATSNFIFLAVTIAVVAVSAAVMQFVRGESLQLDIWRLLAPFLFVALPMLALVAAIAVLFESIPFLRGGFGNLVYFGFYITTIIVSLSSATFSNQGVIEQPITDPFGTTLIAASMLQAAHTVFPDLNLEFGVGYTIVDEPIRAFTWDGVAWTMDIILGRLLWVAAALGISLLAALFFDRFDPSRRKPRQSRTNTSAARKCALRHSWHLPRLDLRHYASLLQLPLPRLGSRLPFMRVAQAELRLMLKGLRWWWYLVALGLVIGGLFAPEARAWQLAAWLWPVLIWSKLGVREKEYHAGALIFSAPKALRRQFSAAWLAGVTITILTGSGAGLHYLLTGEWLHFWAWCVAALFIPTLAITLGVWSGTSKAFEALYIALWYLGPLNGLVALDFMGASVPAIAAEMPLFYMPITLALLALAVLGRWRQIV